MKQIFSIALLVCFTLAFANAQHKRGHHKGDRLEMMKKELGLTDEQIQKMESSKTSIHEEMRKIKESDLSHEEKREKMSMLKEKHKAEMDNILTAEQRTKAEAMKAERKSKFEGMRNAMKEKKEKMKPMMEEIKAYKKENVEPFMVAQRAKLDKAMKKKDRKFIDGIREDLKKDKEEMRAKMKAKKEEFKAKREQWKEKGAEGEMGERPHRGHRGHHKGAPHHKKGKMMHHLQEKYGDQMEDIKSIAEKYSSDIEKLEGEIKAKKVTWDNDIINIKAKYGFDKEEMKRHHKKGMKGMKGKSCEKGDKASCTKEEKAACCPEGSDKDERKAKRDEMKKIGFLLSPSEVREEPKTLDKKSAITTLESKVYPNPSNNSNTLEIEVKEAGQYKVELFDNAGKKVRKIANEKLGEGIKSYQIDLDGLSPGAYYYTIQSPSGRSTVKFVKR